MKTLLRLTLAAVVLAVLAGPSLARIHPKAPSTSHRLEQLSAALHDYLHDNYETTFGAHDMEHLAEALHDTLHDWGNGAASEADVFEALDAANAAFDDMTDLLNDNGLLSGPDQDKEAKKLYHKVHKYLVLVNAFTT